VDQLLEATFRAEVEHFWFRGLRRFAQPLLERALAGRRDPRVLDAGCGTGCNLRSLPGLAGGFGFDLNRVGLAHARGSGLTRLARATVVAIPFRDDTFDVVTSFDVLYALTPGDARRAVCEMARVLKPGGTLIVNVAALEVLRGGHSVLAEEVRRYDRGLLLEDLVAAGLTPQTMTYTNATLFPLVLAARLAQRAAGLDTPEETGHEISVPPRPVNAVLDAILAIESRVVRAVDLPFGSSLLSAATKDDGQPSPTRSS